MTTIKKEYKFEAAHKLWRDDWLESKNMEVFGKCAQLHGHSYTFEVSLAGTVNSETGMILNYYELDKICAPVIQLLDHSFLNDVFPTMLMTAENLAKAISDAVTVNISRTLGRKWDIPYVDQVTVKETAKTSATYYTTEMHEDTNKMP